MRVNFSPKRSFGLWIVRIIGTETRILGTKFRILGIICRILGTANFYKLLIFQMILRIFGAKTILKLIYNFKTPSIHKTSENIVRRPCPLRSLRSLRPHPPTQNKILFKWLQAAKLYTPYPPQGGSLNLTIQHSLEFVASLLARNPRFSLVAMLPRGGDPARPPARPKAENEIAQFKRQKPAIRGINFKNIKKF